MKQYQDISLYWRSFGSQRSQYRKRSQIKKRLQIQTKVSNRDIELNRVSRKKNIEKMSRTERIKNLKKSRNYSNRRKDLRQREISQINNRISNIETDLNTGRRNFKQREKCQTNGFKYGKRSQTEEKKKVSNGEKKKPHPIYNMFSNRKKGLEEKKSQIQRKASKIEKRSQIWRKVSNI